MQNTVSLGESKHLQTSQPSNKPALEVKNKSTTEKVKNSIFSVLGFDDLKKGYQDLSKKTYRPGLYKITLGVAKASISTFVFVKTFEFISLNSGYSVNQLAPESKVCYLNSSSEEEKAEILANKIKNATQKWCPSNKELINEIDGLIREVDPKNKWTCSFFSTSYSCKKRWEAVDQIRNLFSSSNHSPFGKFDDGILTSPTCTTGEGFYKKEYFFELGIQTYKNFSQEKKDKVYQDYVDSWRQHFQHFCELSPE